MDWTQLMAHVLRGLWDASAPPEPETPAEIEAAKKAADRATGDLKPPGGWVGEEKARQRLEQLPDTPRGDRPSTMDDLFWCVARAHYGPGLQAWGWTLAARSWFARTYGVDPRRVHLGPRALGTIVHRVQRACREGIEKRRLDAGAPGRN